MDWEKERQAVKGQAHALSRMFRKAGLLAMSRPGLAVCGCWMGPWTHPIHLFFQKMRKS